MPLLIGWFASAAVASNFEGSIRAAGGRAGAAAELLYTVGTNLMRVEMTATNFPNPIDVVDLRTGQITLIQPMNNTFVRFTPGAPKHFTPPPHARHPGAGIRPQAPRAQAKAGRAHPHESPAGLPPGIGPQPHADGTPPRATPEMPSLPMPPGGLPPGVGPQAQAVPVQRVMPAMPMMPPEKLDFELKATAGKTNLFHYPCRRYEIRQNDEIMEIWATDQLPPFQVYLPTEPHRFGPPIIEEQWGRLVAAQKLFPLRAVLRSEAGAERYRFEVHSITPRRLTKEETAGFQPPEGYVELEPQPL